MSWESLKPTSGPQTAARLAQYGTLYLLPTPPSNLHTPSYWMVGGYKTLQPLAETLRKSRETRDILTAYQVRLGLREDDLPPTSLDQQKSYGANGASPDAGQDHTGKRLSSLFKTATDIIAEMAVHTSRTAKINKGSGASERIRDRFTNKNAFWEKKTPEAHHIVEFTQLECLGVSRGTGVGDLDYHQLPCVLLAAEFHQRFITRILEQVRVKTLPSLGDKRAYLNTLREVYGTLYRRNGTLFLPLWNAAEIILNAAAARLKA